MRNSFTSLIGIGVAALVLSPNLAAQVVQHVELLAKNGPGGPAPRHDLFGAWAGPRGRGGEPSSFTPPGVGRVKLYKTGTLKPRTKEPSPAVETLWFPRKF